MMKRTKEECHKEALKFKHRADFSGKSPHIYQYARKYGWLEEICEHMTRKTWERLPLRTKEYCHEIALKYKKRREFRLSDPQIYQYAYSHNWIEDICGHMDAKRDIKPNGYWNKKRNCIKEAKKYKWRGDFMKGCNRAYKVATKKGWLDEICQHMEVYVAPRIEMSKKEGMKFVRQFKSLTELRKQKNIVASIAQRDGWYDEIQKYFNVTKTKPHGYWTLDRCKEEALKYTKRGHFGQQSQFPYQLARMNGWLEEICSHMDEPLVNRINEYGYWTFDKCKEEALKYNSKRELRENCSACFTKINKRGWGKELTSHFTDGYIGAPKHRNYWTYKRCETQAQKYDKRFHFKKGKRSAYDASLKNGWLDDFFPNMPSQSQ